MAMKGGQNSMFYKTHGTFLKAMYEDGEIESSNASPTLSPSDDRRGMPSHFNLINEGGGTNVDDLHMVLNQVGSPTVGNRGRGGPRTPAQQHGQLNNPETRDMGTDIVSWRQLVQSKDSYIGSLLSRTAVLVHKFQKEVSHISDQVTRLHKEKKSLEDKNFSLMYYVEKAPQRAAEMAKKNPGPPVVGGGSSPRRAGGTQPGPNESVTPPIPVGASSGGIISASSSAFNREDTDHDFRRDAFVAAIKEQEEITDFLKQKLEDAEKRLAHEQHIFEVGSLKHKITLGRLNKLQGASSELQAQLDHPDCLPVIKETMAPFMETLLDALDAKDLDEGRDPGASVNRALLRGKSKGPNQAVPGGSGVLHGSMSFTEAWDPGASSISPQPPVGAFMTEAEISQGPSPPSSPRTRAHTTDAKKRLPKKGGVLAHLRPETLKAAFKKGVPGGYQVEEVQQSPRMAALQNLQASTEQLRSGLHSLRIDVATMQKSLVMQTQGIVTQVLQKAQKMAMLGSPGRPLSTPATLSVPKLYSASNLHAISSPAHPLVRTNTMAPDQRAVDVHSLARSLNAQLQPQSSKVDMAHHRVSQAGAIAKLGRSKLPEADALTESVVDSDLLHQALDVQRRSLLSSIRGSRSPRVASRSRSPNRPAGGSSVKLGASYEGEIPLVGFTPLGVGESLNPAHSFGGGSVRSEFDSREGSGSSSSMTEEDRRFKQERQAVQSDASTNPSGKEDSRRGQRNASSSRQQNRKPGQQRRTMASSNKESRGSSSPVTEEDKRFKQHTTASFNKVRDVDEDPRNVSAFNVSVKSNQETNLGSTTQQETDQHDLAEVEEMRVKLRSLAEQKKELVEQRLQLEAKKAKEAMPKDRRSIGLQCILIGGVAKHKLTPEIPQTVAHPDHHTDKSPVPKRSGSHSPGTPHGRLLHTTEMQIPELPDPEASGVGPTLWPDEDEGAGAELPDHASRTLARKIASFHAPSVLLVATPLTGAQGSILPPSTRSSVISPLLPRPSPRTPASKTPTSKAPTSWTSNSQPGSPTAPVPATPPPPPPVCCCLCTGKTSDRMYCGHCFQRVYNASVAAQEALTQQRVSISVADNCTATEQAEALLELKEMAVHHEEVKLSKKISVSFAKWVQAGQLSPQHQHEPHYHVSPQTSDQRREPSPSRRSEKRPFLRNTKEGEGISLGVDGVGLPSIQALSPRATTAPTETGGKIGAAQWE